jgi:hypothetical protein
MEVLKLMTLNHIKAFVEILKQFKAFVLLKNLHE